MNTLFCYQYRDGANYKQYNEIIFLNPLNRKIDEIESRIIQKLIDRKWFVADNWKIPNQFFKEYVWDNEVDHSWHEFVEVKETKEEATEKNTIEEFLSLINDKTTIVTN